MIVVNDFDRRARRLCQQISGRSNRRISASAHPEIVPDPGFRAAGRAGPRLRGRGLFGLAMKAHLAPVGELGRHGEVSSAALAAPRVFHEFRTPSTFPVSRAATFLHSEYLLGFLRHSRNTLQKKENAAFTCLTILSHMHCTIKRFSRWNFSTFVRKH